MSNFIFFIDGKPSGAILKLGKYDHDYDWYQSEDNSNHMASSSHFEKLHSLKKPYQGITRYDKYS